MREPYFSLYRGEICVSDGWADLIISAEITDEDGGEGDKLMIELDDLDGQIELPAPGVIVRAVGGYKDESECIEGTFEIDQIDVEGWPQKVILHGTSAGAKKATKERKTKAFQPPEFKTYGDVFDYLASQNGWKSRITDELKNTPLFYEAQQEESDTAFATRIAERQDHLTAIKSGNLVVTSKAEGKSVSGAELPKLPITRDTLLKYRVSWKTKPKHGKVEASYFDRDKSEDVTVSDGEGDISFRFREPFATKEEAERAAQARKRELARGEAAATFEIVGNVRMGTQIPIEVIGIRKRVDGDWNPTRVTHRFSVQGYVCSIETQTNGKKKKKKKNGSSKEYDPYWDDDPDDTTNNGDADGEQA